MTLTLAIIGSATGIGGLATQVIKTWRERSKLRLNFGITTAIGERPSAWIDVYNDAPRATTVREVGFYAKPVRVQINSQQDGQTYTGETSGTFAIGGPTFLEAGQTERFTGNPDTISHGIHADQPLRVYAMDARGRKVWGDAAPVVRMLVGPNPPLDQLGDDPVRPLLEPASERMLPLAVEPRWKLWTRRELRDPSAWKA